ncbi:MAG: PIN domain-containing protein [Bacillota bacterium]|nr:PIN domain-containing protein [Bacillota bacterium]
MFRKFYRAIFTTCGMFFGFGMWLLFDNVLLGLIVRMNGNVVLSETQETVGSIACVLGGGLLFFLLAPLFIRQSKQVAKNIESDLRKVPSNELWPAAAGMVLGLVMAYLISTLFEGLEIPYLSLILSIITYLFLGYLGAYIGGKRGKDMLPALNLTKKGAEGGGKKKKGAESTPKILDTSVIIDGRIADIMKTGFIEGSIVIPEFVLIELQHIADSSDSLKRNRGRRGLDVLNRIQNDYGIEIYDSSGEKSLEDIPEVDVKLLKLAQVMNGKVVTNDYNLNKVALIKGVEVLNINELANTLKPVVLPGETMTIFLVKEGKENNQGVAYLDDGTMIVVEDGKRYIGQTVDAVVTSVLQTAAGRMIFTKPKR